MPLPKKQFGHRQRCLPAAHLTQRRNTTAKTRSATTPARRSQVRARPPLTSQRVIAEKPRIGKLGQIFPCTLQENYTLDRKMDETFFDGHDELYQHAKFGEDRTTRAGCTCENVVFVFFVTLRIRSAVRSAGAQFEHAFRCHLQADFGVVCSVFSDTLHSSHIRRQVAPQFSLNCGKKLRKVQNSAEKFVRTTSYRQLTDLEKIRTLQFRAENVDVHLYKTFAARRYLALTASVKFRIGSPKTARNEQACAHQKSYRK